MILISIDIKTHFEFIEKKVPLINLKIKISKYKLKKEDFNFIICI